MQTNESIMTSASFLDPEQKQTINVLMVYEDFESGLRAKHLYDRISHQMKQECIVNQSMWKVDVLLIQSLGAIAGEDAAMADIIILSLRGDRELCKTLNDWMEHWVCTTPVQRKALVALFDNLEENKIGRAHV